MRHTTISRTCATVAVTAALTLCGANAHAQSSETSEGRCGTEMPSVKQLFTGTADGFRRLKSGDSLGVLALGAAVAAGTHAADKEVSEDFAHAGALRRTFKPGTYIGGSPLELGASAGVYAIGRALHHPCAAAVGADLVSAQLMAQALTQGIKLGARRSRPDGSSYSFPSGHTAMAFASATVLQKRFGWKVGIPAYAVASYVGASRVQTERHYLSDVVFGAAVGIVAGRSVTFGSQRFLLSPTASRRGGGVSLSWTGHK